MQYETFVINANPCVTVAVQSRVVIDSEGRIVYLGHQWERAQRTTADLLSKRP